MSERGSALVMAVFVLAILSGMALALALLTDNAMFMSLADRRSKQAYFLAEAGAEAGRQALYNTNGSGSFDNDLVTAAGADTNISFDPDTIRPVVAADGTVTALTGYGDDVPLIPLTALDDGWYAVFLTNDDANSGGWTSTNDDNDRIMLTGIGASADGGLEVIQVIAEKATPFPADIPAMTTMFGPGPTWNPAATSSKTYVGDDCNGLGIPGFNVPTVGLLRTSWEAAVEGALGSPVYTSGGDSSHLTVVNLTDVTDPGVVGSSLGTIDPAWEDCEAFRARVEEVRARADVVCIEGNSCTLPASSPGRVIFAEGDFTLGSSDSGAGLLWVTGRLTIDGATNWNGILMVVGEGQLYRSGAGTGVVSGATVIADIAGPDNIYGTSDDCSGGTDGFAGAVYDESAGGTGVTTYCNTDVLAATPVTRYAVAGFRQR